MVYSPGENLVKDPEEVKLQNASKQIVETIILQAVQQISEEEMKEEKRETRKADETEAARRSSEGQEKK